jgi:hypothetical protein
MSDEPEDISIAAGLVSAIGTRQEWARAFDDHLDYLDRLISGIRELDTAQSEQRIRRALKVLRRPRNAR